MLIRLNFESIRAVDESNNVAIKRKISSPAGNVKLSIKSILFYVFFLVSFCSFYSCFIIVFVALVGNVSSNKIYVPIRF